MCLLFNTLYLQSYQLKLHQGCVRYTIVYSFNGILCYAISNSKDRHFKLLAHKDVNYPSTKIDFNLTKTRFG